MSLSNSQSFDILQIKTTRQITITSIYTIETLKKDIVINCFIPTQMTADQAAQLQKIQKSSEYASYALVSSNLVLNVFLSGILSYLFGLLNDISQIIMLSLININIPGQAQLIMNMLMNLIYMDLLQTDLWLEKQMNIEDDDQALCPSFKQAGYSSHNTVSNLGSTFVFILILATLYIIFALLTLLNKTKLIFVNTVDKWNQKAFWNLPVRFFIQQFQAILISSLLSIVLSLNKFKISTEEFKESIDSSGKRIGVFFGLMLLASSIVIPLLMARVIYKHSRELNSSKFTSKFGTLLEGLNVSKHQGGSPYFNILVLFRWGIQIAILVFLNNFPSLQIIILLALSLAFTLAVSQYKPYQTYSGYFNINENDFKVFNNQPHYGNFYLNITHLRNKRSLKYEQFRLQAINNINFLNEVMVSYYLFAMMLLTDFNSDDDIRSSAGVCELSIICLSVFCNILKAALIGINELIRKRELKKNKVQKYVQDLDPLEKINVTTAQKEDHSISELINCPQEAPEIPIKRIQSLQLSQSESSQQEVIEEEIKQQSIIIDEEEIQEQPESLISIEDAYDLPRDYTMQEQHSNIDLDYSGFVIPEATSDELKKAKELLSNFQLRNYGNYR